MITVSQDTTTITVTDVIGYRTERDSGNVVDTPLDDAAPAVRFGTATTRAGRLRFLMADEADSFALEALHASGGVFELADDETPAVDMSYVCTGSIVHELDEETRAWWVEVEFREVAS